MKHPNVPHPAETDDILAVGAANWGIAGAQATLMGAIHTNGATPTMGGCRKELIDKFSHDLWGLDDVHCTM